MIYFKLTDEIKSLIAMLPEVKERKIQLGCKSYCNKQIIALDELELLKKLLAVEKIKVMSTDEFITLKSGTEALAFRNTHICSDPSESSRPVISEEEKKRLIDEELKELMKDKVPKKTPYMFERKSDYEYYEKKRLEEEKDTMNRHSNYALRESTASYGVSLIISFFLVIFGTYSVCKFVGEFTDETSFKITLVVSIIVMFAEAVLLLIKLEKDNNKDIKLRGGKKQSFAYRFNKQYRMQQENPKDQKPTKMKEE